ncbi:hypothetical protein K0U00_42880, partial [Paenibacillus sepulcri]|nr:hypothetical protein [Paenibacillus sepulcri]
MAGQHKAANIVHFSRLSEEGYRWLREDKAGWRSEGEALHIAALPGSLWEDSNNARNILIRSEGLAGAVRLEVEVTLAPERNSEQAGLLL